jgi:hypothetical protein
MASRNAVKIATLRASLHNPERPVRGAQRSKALREIIALTIADQDPEQTERRQRGSLLVFSR